MFLPSSTQKHHRRHFTDGVMCAKLRRDFKENCEIYSLFSFFYMVFLLPSHHAHMSLSCLQSSVEWLCLIREKFEVSVSLLYIAEHNPVSEKAIILTASSDVTHIIFPASLRHTDGHLMFKGDDVTTEQAAMLQSAVLLCCNPVEHDKLPPVILHHHVVSFFVLFI